MDITNFKKILVSSIQKKIATIIYFYGGSIETFIKQNNTATNPSYRPRSISVPLKRLLNPLCEHKKRYESHYIIFDAYAYGRNKKEFDGGEMDTSVLFDIVTCPSWSSSTRLKNRSIETLAAMDAAIIDYDSISEQVKTKEQILINKFNNVEYVKIKNLNTIFTICKGVYPASNGKLAINISPIETQKVTSDTFGKAASNSWRTIYEGAFDDLVVVTESELHMHLLTAMNLYKQKLERQLESCKNTINTCEKNISLVEEKIKKLEQ